MSATSLSPSAREQRSSDAGSPPASSGLPAIVDSAAHGDRMHALIRELYPICRSITGDGFRKTMARIAERIPLEIHEVATGTPVFDWTIPREWNIRDAWVKNAAGEKIIDLQKSNLHVVNYSVPVHRRMSLAELAPHLHSLPEKPQWTPYRTSYYREDWGFCLPHQQREALADSEYEVFIDSTLADGALTYGELLIPGRRDDEVLLSCHACHPSLCNDNLSGIALLTELASVLRGASLEYSYRFLFVPGTIGSIAWLARNVELVGRIRHGLVAACVGDSGAFHYKRSRRGDATIDRAAAVVLKHRPEGHALREFSPYGYDERQYCSPGFDLPVGCLSRTPHGEFPEYHTSADDLSLVRADELGRSLEVYRDILAVLEGDGRFINENPRCEPQLGRRGLYRAMGGLPEAGKVELALLWALNLSDGDHSLLEIAERSGLTFESIHQASVLLRENGLLREARA